MRQRTHVFVLAALMASVSGCAAYQIGNRSLYRPDVRTIHVPMFTSDSFRRNLGERLTEAVVKEIESQTPYKVVPASRADSILYGKITMDSKRVVAEDRTDVPRIIDTDMTVQIEWTGRQGNLLTNTISMPVDSYPLIIGQSQDLLPEAGQSVTTSQQRDIEMLAKQIVEQLEMPSW